jgi:hypothetical protein
MSYSSRIIPIPDERPLFGMTVSRQLGVEEWNECAERRVRIKQR